MSIAGYFTEKRVVTIFSILLIATAGYLSYGNLGRLEDPEFTIKEVRSISRAGLSIVIAEMQDIYDKDTLPQVWDELRRKVSEAARTLNFKGCDR